jgi:hypothetical protein
LWIMPLMTLCNLLAKSLVRILMDVFKRDRPEVWNRWWIIYFWKKSYMRTV